VGVSRLSLARFQGYFFGYNFLPVKFLAGNASLKVNVILYSIGSVIKVKFMFPDSSPAQYHRNERGFRTRINFTTRVQVKAGLLQR